jgi:hypothetical protein
MYYLIGDQWTKKFNNMLVNNVVSEKIERITWNLRLDRIKFYKIGMLKKQEQGIN